MDWKLRMVSGIEGLG